MEKYFTPEEMAEVLKVTRKTVYNWLQTGKLKGLKAGDLWRIPQSALEEFLHTPEGKE